MSDRAVGMVVVGVPKLLEPGKCGATPPKVKLHHGRWAEHHGQYEPLVSTVALPVWWGGEFVPEGYDRLCRAAGATSDVGREWGLRAGIGLVQAARKLGGRIVLVDRHGVGMPKRR